MFLYCLFLPDLLLFLTGWCWVGAWMSCKGNTAPEKQHTVYSKGRLSCETMMPFFLQYVLILCNTIGTPLDSKYIDIGEWTQLALGEHLSSLDCTPVGIVEWPHPESAQRGKVKALEKVPSVKLLQEITHPACWYRGGCDTATRCPRCLNDRPSVSCCWEPPGGLASIHQPGGRLSVCW